ncbi:MerR HTH family regulatory protein [Paenibacillus catalpae]|uniref:MerR HTH family regulatory protein n=1 Tax=Paenibacillus catalpae TaxID=1045775 RepID=A0A1I1UNH8_9BACL|nr:MerR HTH family regulatory protein [Paenibacillus catalpae]
MLYTVKEVSEMSNVTIKTLHHYHKIGLLMPSEISEAGYRLYGIHELQRLQEILLYRELEFSLDQIKHLLNANPDRQSILQQQEALLSRMNICRKRTA